MLEPGQVLRPVSRNPRGLFATVLPDGSLDVGQIYTTPSGAAVSITGKPTNGWAYFVVDDHPSRRSLRKVLQGYVDQLAVDVDDEDQGLDDEDDA